MRRSIVSAALILGIILSAIENYLFAEMLVLLVAFTVAFVVAMIFLLTLVLLDAFADHGYVRIKARIDKIRLQHVANSALGKP